jgi:hypothetical protein
MKFVKNNLFDVIFLIILSSIVIIFGYFFSIYNSDFHHWGFIARHSLDFINGGKLFEEVFVQYGVGQLILFKFINYFYVINFTSVGVITSIFYSLNLIIIYLIIKRIASTFIAFFILSVILFIHPFVFLPWPDYIAGLFLSLFCFFLIFGNSNKNITYLLCGSSLFLSIIFRTTYILNIAAACLVYLLLLKFNKKFYSKLIVNSLIYFFIFLSFYFIYLIINNNFFDWGYQGLGVIKDYAYDSNYVHKNWIVKNFGEYFWIILKFCKMLLRFFIKLIFPNKLEDLILFIFFIINILFIFLFLSKKMYNLLNLNFNIENNAYLFISFLGFFGIIQSIFFFNFFKNINSSSSIFFTSAIILNFFFKNKFLKKKNDYYIFSFVILFILLFKFISTFKENFKVTNSLYYESSIDYFGKRKFIKEDLEYYNEMKKSLCRDNKKIINFTLDQNLFYICSTKNFSAHPEYTFLFKISPNLHERLFNGKLFKNEILITPQGPDFKDLQLYNSVRIPKSCCSWWMGDWPSKFFYIYSKE